MTSGKKLFSTFGLAGGLAAALAIVSITGCGKNGPLNSDTVGDMFGGTTGSLIKGAGHEANALAMSEADEDSMGQSVGVVVTSRYGVYNNDALQTYVTMVGLTVASGSSNPTGNYVFGVLDTSEINAFSGPNGYILVTRGAIENMKDEAELAGVLGHEIAHVCHHDGLKQVQMAEHQAALQSALQASDKAQQFSQFTDFGIDAITKTGYSQPQETAADADGVKFMVAAGYNPDSFRRFLQRLQQMQGTSGNSTIMSTHPGTADRIAKVTKEIDDMKHPAGATLADRFARNVSFAH
ncbi:MAG: M48 family metalloprotease [Planctomycetota bacterium]|nr:M48 family metalloprotease [Planctomycetota bacterium]